MQCMPDNTRTETSIVEKTPAPVLRLTLHHHPGTLLQVVSLLQRRNIPVGALLNVPQADRRTSVILLQIGEAARLDQVKAQLERLEDLVSVTEEPERAEWWQAMD